MSDQATAVATEAPAAAPAAPEAAPAPAEAPAQGGQQGAGQAPAQGQKPFLSKSEARRGLHDTARAVEKTVKPERAAPAKAEQPAETELELEVEDEQDESVEVVEEQSDPQTGQHPQWQAGDPEGTYRDSEGRLRHATGPLKGKFAAPETGGSEGEKAAAADGRAPDAKPEAKAAGPRPIRVEIPEGHAVREMGLAAIEVADERSAEAVKALANGTYVRRQENEQLRKEVTDLKRQLIEQEAKGAAQQRWRSTPEYRAAVEKYREIAEDHGKDTADEWWQGKAAELKRLEAQEFEQRWSAVEQQEADKAAEAWKAEARTRVSARVPAEIRTLPDYGRWFEEEVQFLNLRLEQGHLPDVKTAEDLHKALGEALSARLVREPASRAVLMQQLEAAKAKTREQETEAQKKTAAAAVDGFKKSAAEKRVKAPPHPLGGMGHAATTDRVAAPGDPAQADVSEMSPHQLRRHLKAGARQDARRHLTGNR